MATCMRHSQIGRAGRDGREAWCHLFLDDADFRRLRSLGHSDRVRLPFPHAHTLQGCRLHAGQPEPA